MIPTARNWVPETATSACSQLHWYFQQRQRCAASLAPSRPTFLGLERALAGLKHSWPFPFRGPTKMLAFLLVSNLNSNMGSAPPKKNTPRLSVLSVAMCRWLPLAQAHAAPRRLCDTLGPCRLSRSQSSRRACDGCSRTSRTRRLKVGSPKVVSSKFMHKDPLCEE